MKIITFAKALQFSTEYISFMWQKSFLCHLFVTRRTTDSKCPCPVVGTTYQGWIWGRVQGGANPPPLPWDEAFFFVYTYSLLNFFTSPSVTSFLRGAPLLRKILHPPLQRRFFKGSSSFLQQRMDWKWLMERKSNQNTVSIWFYEHISERKNRATLK